MNMQKKIMKEEQILLRYGIVILTSCQRFLSFIDLLVTEKKEVQLYCFPPNRHPFIIFSLRQNTGRYFWWWMLNPSPFSTANSVWVVSLYVWNEQYAQWRLRCAVVLEARNVNGAFDGCWLCWISSVHIA